MPTDQDTPSIGDQLAEALAAMDVNQTELARRLAGTRERKPVESKRRWIQKVLADDIEAPDMAPVAAALSLPTDYFRLPTPEETQRRRVRLKEVSAKVDKLRREFDLFVQAATARQAGREVAPEQAKPQSGRRSTGRRGKVSG